MRAHLIQVAEDGAVASIPVPTRGLEIGRDANADLRIESDRVSRRHARILGRSGRHLLSDLGSANGTFLNGQRVQQPVVLNHGDEVDLAGEVSFVYQAGSDRRVHWLTAAAVLLAAAVLMVAAAAWVIQGQLRKGPDPIWEGALALASEGIAAQRAGDSAAARTKLKSAAGLL